MPVGEPAGRLPELLAPAGDEDSLRAAVANGADAVYFGLDDFNARRRATNFTLTRLPELVHWLHRRNVRAYVAFNTLVFSGELNRASEYVAGIAEAGVDAVIVQDLGLMRLVRAMCPRLPIHASTQTTQTHAAGIAFLKSLGVSRVIVARELSIEQIAAISRATDVELEVFVHGAICISFSGQCLASEVMWGRSANRGLCAQACRLPYALEVEGHRTGAEDRPYLLSPRDLCAAGLVDRLAALGVAGLKIEGRLKSAAYVASATRVYRELLDGVAKGRASRLTRAQELELTLSFSRGFTTGFLGGADSGELVDGRFPRSRGLLVGRVEGRTRRGIVVRLGDEWRAGECPLSPGDGVVFDDRRAGSAERGGRIYEVHPRGGPGRCIELAFGRDDLEVQAVAVGSDVWKTDDPALRRELERSGRKVDAVRRARVSVRAEAAEGQALRLRFRDADGREVAVESAQALTPATRHPLTVDLLRAQLGRLGDTPFALGDVELMGAEGRAESVPVMAPKSLLNELRREAVEMLLAARDAAGRHEVVRPGALGEVRAELTLQLPQAGETPASPAWAVLVRMWEQLGAVLDWRGPAGVRPAVVYVDAACGESPARGGYAEAVRAIRGAGLVAGLATTVVTMPGEEQLLDEVVTARPDVVLVRNLAAGVYLRERAASLTLVADYALNAANELTAGVLAEGGFARVTPSYDLSAGQSAAMRTRSPGVAAELIVHGHVPMFHTAHRLAGSDAGGVQLRDNDGRRHRVLIDAAGRTTVFSAAVQSTLGVWAEARQPRPACVRVELLSESADQTRTVLDTYAGVLAGSLPPPEALRRLASAYPCGVTAGTLAETFPAGTSKPR